MNQPGLAPYSQPHFSPSGAYGSLIPPAPPPPKKSSVGLFIGLGIGGILVLAAGGVGAYLFATGKQVKGSGLPVDAKYLPSSTKEVGSRLIEATREPNEEIKSAYLASELGSALCNPGIIDPAGQIEGIGSKHSSPRIAKELFFNKKRIDETQQLLECGSLLSTQLESPYAGYIRFEDEAGKKQDVAVAHITVTELPSRFGYTRQSFGSMRGFCRPLVEDKDAKPGDTNDDKVGECKDKSFAAFPSGTTWFLGEKQELDLVARAVARPREELGASIQAIKAASEQTEGMPVVRLAGNPKTSKDFIMAPCAWAWFQTLGLRSNFLEACFPGKSSERLLTEVESRVKAAAYELDGDYQKAQAIKGNIIFVARDNDSAKELEKDVNDLVTDWKDHLDANRAKVIKETKEMAVTHSQKKFAAVVDTFFEALAKMKVIRSGRTIRIAYNEKLSPDDVLGLQDADQKTVEKRIATARILEAIQDKKPIPVGPLTKLVGAKWATYLAGPPPGSIAEAAKKVRTSTDDCRDVQKRLQSVKVADVSHSEGRVLYWQLKVANCSAPARPELSPMQLDCLKKFKDTSEFGHCAEIHSTASREPPESEFGEKANKE